MFPPKSELVLHAAHRGFNFEAEFAKRETGMRFDQTWDRLKVAENLGQVHAMICSGWFDVAWLDHAPNLKFIQACSAGYNYFDLDALKARGIRLCNATGVNANSVADHTLAFILAHHRNFAEHFANAPKRHWPDMHTNIAEREDELAGKTLGIFGYGTIGAQIATRARAFDLKVIGFKRSPGEPGPADEVRPITAFKDSLAELDILVLTCPLTDETRNLMDAETFQAMKPGSFFVNVARGGCVHEPSLVEALKSGHLAGAGVDVQQEEPHPADGPLWEAPNLLLSPHRAGDTRRYEINVIDLFLENLDRLSRGEDQLKNQIL